jgi:hypothetical protein
MNHWYDFGSVCPPDGILVRLRRYPGDTPPYYGMFDFDSGIASSQVGEGYTFTAPWSVLTHWSPLAGSPGEWSRQVSPPNAWRDPFWSTPTDGQHCWLRRGDEDTATVRGDWHTALAAFTVQGTTWRLPWYLVWKWKPA